MSELWVPAFTENPDIDNIFDMTMLYQERLFQFDDLASAEPHASIAINSLNAHVQTLTPRQKDLTVRTHGSIIESMANPDNRVFMDTDVGIQGKFKEVQPIPLKIGNGVPQYHLAIILGIHKIFLGSSPDDVDQLTVEGAVPITMVDAIESVA